MNLCYSMHSVYQRAVHDFDESSVAYVPLIAPSTTIHRIRFLASIADTFIYVVSKVRWLTTEVGDISNSDLKQMGTTGSSDKVALNSALPDIIARVKEHATVPLAVGFGVSTREHFLVDC
jgi:tryptophan synthase